MKWLALLIFAGLNASAGVLVGNGGDSVFCKPVSNSARFTYEGFYFLDFVLDFPDDLAGISTPTGLKASLNRIENLVRTKAPQLLDSFLSFREPLDPAPFRLTPGRRWQGSQKPLRPINDEVAKYLPKNCQLRDKNSKRYGIYQQTIVRQNVRGGISYAYDIDKMNGYLTDERVLQASVLFVHEWLWDFYETDRLGAVKIRKANAFLHSGAAETASPSEFQKYFKL